MKRGFLLLGVAVVIVFSPGSQRGTHPLSFSIRKPIPELSYVFHLSNQRDIPPDTVGDQKQIVRKVNPRLVGEEYGRRPLFSENTGRQE